MAGSKKWFLYTTDLGNDFAMEMDESNGEAISNTDMTDANLQSYSVPGNVRKRYASYRSTDGFTQRKIYASTAAILAAAPDTITVPDYAGVDVELKIAHRSGERIFMPKAADTALDDGDVT